MRRPGRMIALVAILVLAAATVTAVAFGTAAAPGRRAAIAPVRPAAVVPDQFSPFIAYAAFGWLPAGYKLLEGGTTRGSTYQVAWRPSLSTAWYLLAYPAGGCQLTQARGLMCKAYYPFGPLALTSRAPDINGHRAYWATAYADLPSPKRVLAWQYAPGSWAVLELGKTKPLGARWRQVAVKAASHARFGVHAEPPVAFPIQLTGLPASWRLISGVRAWMPEWNGVTYQPYGHVLYASHWSVSTGSVSTGPRARPFLTFTIGLAGQPGSCRVPVQGSIRAHSRQRLPGDRHPRAIRAGVVRRQRRRAVCADRGAKQWSRRGPGQRGRGRLVRPPPATAGHQPSALGDTTNPVNTTSGTRGRRQ